MSETSWQLVVVPQAFPSQCPVTPCPYCALGLPHDATSDDVLTKTKEMTCDTNKQLNKMVCSYTYRCGAARHILTLHHNTKKLPAAPSMFDLAGPELCRDYSCHMAPLIDPAAAAGPPPRTANAHPMSPPTAAGPQASTGSGSTPTGLKRWMDDDEFPQWQYMGGKRKNKWATYDPACNEHLEGAYQAGAIVVELTSDDWKYTVNLRDWTQTNCANGTVRGVRRLQEAER